jgi:hypothetical protein
VIVDNFLDDFKSLKDYADSAEFKSEKNPADGVTYPFICKDIPESLKERVLSKIKSHAGITPRIHTIFMRRSPEGVSCPHKVHSDNSMGDYSLMLYMDDKPHGTSLVNHKKTGAKHVKYSSDIIDSIIEDQNNDDAWEIYQMNYGKPNRAFIFDAHLLHRAEPVGGYGEGKDARTVLTCFFS